MPRELLHDRRERLPGEDVPIARRAQRLREVAQRPRVLCLDEPTSGLGSDGIQRLLELIARIRSKLTIVMIEHDMHFLFSLAERISVIHWGQVVARGAPAELRANEWVQRSNLGRFA